MQKFMAVMIFLLAVAVLVFSGWLALESRPVWGWFLGTGIFFVIIAAASSAGNNAEEKKECKKKHSWET
jgi:polyferredoxin